MKNYAKFVPAINSRVAGITLMAGMLGTALAEEQTTRERVLHHRAMEAAIWAMPVMNYKFYRDALIGAGVGSNDVGYYSKVQDWKFQTATPNNTTPYILAHWTVKDGPIVVEIPPATEDVGIFWHPHGRLATGVGRCWSGRSRQGTGCEILISASGI